MKWTATFDSVPQLFRSISKPGASDLEESRSMHFSSGNHSFQWMWHVYHGEGGQSVVSRKMALTSITASILGAGFWLGYLSESPRPSQTAPSAWSWSNSPGVRPPMPHSISRLCSPQRGAVRAWVLTQPVRWIGVLTMRNEPPRPSPVLTSMFLASR